MWTQTEKAEGLDHKQKKRRRKIENPTDGKGQTIEIENGLNWEADARDSEIKRSK